MPEQPKPSRWSRLDRSLGRIYSRALTLFFVAAGGLCLWIVTKIWKSEGGVERWAGLGLTALAALACLALARKASKRERVSEWLDDL